MGVLLDVTVSTPGRPSRRVKVRPAARDGWVIIGSAAGCDVRVHDPRVAPRQCRVGPDGDRIVVEIASEGVGARLNGQVIGERGALHPGDVLTIGESTVTFESIMTDDEAPTPAPGAIPAARPPVPAARVPATQPPPVPPIPPGVAAPRTAVTLAASPAGPQPKPAPAEGIPPPGDSGATLLDRLLHRLRQEYNPRCFERKTETELRRMLERALRRASSYGFEDDAGAEVFLRCVVITGDELVGPETPAADVYYALTNTSWGIEERLRRALRQATRYAKNSLGFDPASRSAPVSSPLRSQPSPPPPSPARPVLSPAVSPVPSRPHSAASDDESTRRGVEHNVTEGEFPPAPPPLEPHDPDRDDPPPEIEGYEYLAPLGGGGMGRVFKYRDCALECEVAIKVVRSHFHDAHRQIRIEAQNAAKLRHPNVVPVMGFREDARRGYYIMQFVKGKDSHRLVQDCALRVGARESLNDILGIAGVDLPAVLPEIRSAAGRAPAYYCVVAAWIAGAADGLAAAHMAQIVHRDVKPSNLIVGPDGRMMILDFGLATTAYDTATGGVRVGTPRYLAPETVAEWAAGVAQPPEPGIDIWGLGATLYELLALAPAFPSRGSEALVLRDIVTRDPTPPRQVRWDVPERLEEICLRALRRNPDDRYRSMGEFAADLRDWLDNAGKSPSKRDSKSGKRLWR